MIRVPERTEDPVKIFDMKSLFPEFFLDDKNINNRIWDNGVIVFDTNVLLNIYEYSQETANNYLLAMEACKDRIWIPNWVIYEFLVQREKIIETQLKSYESLNQDIRKAIKPLESKSKHPYVSEEIYSEIQKKINEVIEDVKKSQSVYKESCSSHKDQKLERFCSLFSSNIGRSYSEEELGSIIKTGENRMKDKIPPGYKDFQSKADKDKCSDFLERCSRYGDFIIWRQLLDYAKKRQKDIIFITNDGKEDWCDEKNRARRELVKEFLKETDKKVFRIFQPSDFLEYVNSHKKAKKGQSALQINQATLEEVRNIEKSPEIIIRMNNERVELNDYEIRNQIKEYQIRHEILNLKNQIMDLYREKESIDLKKQNLKEELDDNQKYFFKYSNRDTSEFEEENYKKQYVLTKELETFIARDEFLARKLDECSQHLSDLTYILETSSHT